jgi:hypothetical protein
MADIEERKGLFERRCRSLMGRIKLWSEALAAIAFAENDIVLEDALGLFRRQYVPG